MLRFFVVLLLLIICFLGGALYGMDHYGLSAEESETGEESLTESARKKTIETKELEEALQEDRTMIVDVDVSEHYTQKTASALEAGVKGFFEVIVKILYQISQLFF